VRVAVSVPAQTVEAALAEHARTLAKRIKIPGFRRGKIPPELVIRRLGREALLEEVTRDQIGAWYVAALAAKGITPVGDPQITLGALPAPGEPFSFSFAVAVLPQATLGKYLGVEAPRREARAEEELLSAELEALRERFARLEDVQRPAAIGDFVVIDYRASVGGRRLGEGEGRDELYELGGSELPEAIQRALIGAQAGEAREAQFDYPAEHPDQRLAGKSAHFDVTLKAVKRKELPEIDEDLAADAGFESLAQLRGEIEAAVLAADAERVRAEFREAALDAVVAAAKVAVPEGHIRARAQEIWERTSRRLGARGVSPAEYLRISGRSEQELLSELLPVAEQSIKREAVLAAVIDAEGIQPSDEEVLSAFLPESDEALAGEDGMDGGEPPLPGAEQGEQPDAEGAIRRRTPQERERLLEQLREAGQLEELRERLAVQRALELIAEQAKPIAPERAAARERLWTPEAGRAAAGESSSLAGAAAGEGEERRGLWTPSASR